LIIPEYTARETTVKDKSHGKSFLYHLVDSVPENSGIKIFGLQTGRVEQFQCNGSVYASASPVARVMDIDVITGRGELDNP
jgi:hypothetical protein